jgi:hypothetical protein
MVVVIFPIGLVFDGARPQMPGAARASNLLYYLVYSTHLPACAVPYGILVYVCQRVLDTPVLRKVNFSTSVKLG